MNQLPQPFEVDGYLATPQLGKPTIWTYEKIQPWMQRSAEIIGEAAVYENTKHGEES